MEKAWLDAGLFYCTPSKKHHGYCYVGVVLV
jgi:hypothetical protein